MPDPTIEPVPLEAVVDLVNEYADAPRTAAGEEGSAYSKLAGPIARLARGRPTGDLVTVANALFPVFSQGNRQAAATLNSLLWDTGVAPRLKASGTDATTARWVAEPGADRLVAACALALWQWLSASEGRPVGTCAADRCVDVFVDLSPAGVKKYCSTTCLTRTKVAAHRARQRAARRAR